MSDSAPSTAQTQQAAPGFPGVALSVDQELRRQCLIWAFQTRDFCDVPHMHVVNVAQAYHDFICRTPARLREEAWQESQSNSL